MPAKTGLVLNTKSYAPRGKNSGDVATWALVGDASFGSATSFTTESVRGPNKDSNYKIQFKLDLPKAATASDACACVGTQVGRGICDIVVTIPAGFSASERDDFTKRIQSLVASAVFTAACTSLEGSW